MFVEENLLYWWVVVKTEHVNDRESDKVLNLSQINDGESDIFARFITKMAAFLVFHQCVGVQANAIAAARLLSTLLLFA